MWTQAIQSWMEPGGRNRVDAWYDSFVEWLEKETPHKEQPCRRKEQHQRQELRTDLETIASVWSHVCVHGQTLLCQIFGRQRLEAGR